MLGIGSPIFMRSFGNEISIQFNLLFRKGRWAVHLILVLLLVRMLHFLNFPKSGAQLQDWYRMAFVWLMVILCAYTFLLLVIPFAKLKKSAVIVWAGFAINYLFWALVLYVLLPLAPGNYNFGSTKLYFFLGFLQFNVFPFFSFYYFFDLYLQQKQLNNYRKKLEEKIKVENQFLKKQINPHFLFNTLNNVYSKSLKSPVESVESIGQLQKMLRYMLYDCEYDFVRLKDEISFLESYVRLEKIRNIAAASDISFVVKGTIVDQNIAPLILINFVENAFKHSSGTEQEKGFIRIAVEVNNRELQFSVFNSRRSSLRHTTIDSGGIGIENVKRRLGLLYPQRHNLKIEEKEDSYLLKLNIKLY